MSSSAPTAVAYASSKRRRYCEVLSAEDVHYVPGPRLFSFVGADEVGTSFVPNTFGTDEAKKPGTGSEADVPGGVWANIGPVLNFLDANATVVGTRRPSVLNWIQDLREIGNAFFEEITDGGRGAG